jgi:hypothetical protein
MSGLIESTRRALNVDNVPPKMRAYQLANAVLTPFVCRRWRICHVVEYPKCGGSWVSNMLRSYVGVDFNDGYRLLKRNDVVQKHVLHRTEMAWPIVVVRDPRDMYVSCYYHETQFEDREANLAIGRYFKRDPDRSIREDFAEYLEAKLLNVTHPRFYYSQFLDSWLNRPQTCVVRYEDCLRDPEAALIRMVRFSRRPIDPERIRRAVEENSFGSVTKRLYGEERTPGEQDNTRFVRRGQAGDWKNHFDRRSCELIERFEGSSLRRLGYETDGDWIETFLADSEIRP